MKLDQLDLRRYGHLSDVGLCFPPDSRLCVVLGANEAGKSTALAAISDALFGFGHRSEYDFLHGGPNLSVGITITSADGGRRQFIRRKGRNNTLRDERDDPVPETALLACLGHATREVFEQSFGLNALRLREGANEILRAGGDLGEALLAGAGVLRLRQVLNKLDEEARRLVGDGRGRRDLSEAFAKWKNADQEVKRSAIAPKEYSDAVRERQAKQTELDELQRTINQHRAEQHRLHRVRRIAPILRQLDDARQRLHENAAVPALPKDAQKRVEHSLREREQAQRNIVQEAKEIERLQRELEEIPCDSSVLDVQDSIDALAERRQTILDAQRDLLALRDHETTKRARLHVAVEGLGLDFSLEAAVTRIPSRSVRNKITRLKDDLTGKMQSLAERRRFQAKALRQYNEAADKVRATPAPASPRLLRDTIERVKQEGRITDELAKAERERDLGEQKVTMAVAALPLWQGDAASLTSLALPLEADEIDSGTRLLESGATLHKAHERIRQARDTLAELESTIEKLQRGSPVPTPEAVADARRLRDDLWRNIRHRLQGDTGGATADADEPPPENVIQQFEKLSGEADLLADRRADDAQRVASYLDASAKHQSARTELDVARASEANATAAYEAARGAWEMLWCPCGFVPGLPDAMRQWRKDRAEVIRKIETLDEKQQKYHDLVHRRDRAFNELSALLPPFSTPETLMALLRRAESLCADAETAEKEYKDLIRTADSENKRLADADRDTQAAEADLEASHQAWTDAIPVLGLPDDTDIETAEAALAAWSQIAELAPGWKSDVERIHQMETAISAFTTEVRKLQHTMDDHSDEAAEVVLPRLARRLSDARNALHNAEHLRAQIATHHDRRNEAGRHLSASTDEIMQLRRMAGVDDDTALQQAIERTILHDRAASDEQQHASALLVQGDGFGEDALREEFATTDVDGAAARITAIEDELKSLHERRDRLNEEHLRTCDMIATLTAGRDTARYAQAAADALAESRSIAERYARLHVARTLLRAGIERFRTEQQDPVLRHAGAHFRMLTDGRYVRLSSDQDQAGRILLLAVRDEGTECPIDKLSEGTRDQLYLALRIAAIELQLEQREKLPFIADDLLVNFDDRRANAAIRLLLQLGDATQVILFTHHEHIANLAAGHPGVSIQQLPGLPVQARVARASLAAAD